MQFPSASKPTLVQQLVGSFTRPAQQTTAANPAMPLRFTQKDVRDFAQIQANFDANLPELEKAWEVDADLNNAPTDENSTCTETSLVNTPETALRRNALLNAYELTAEQEKFIAEMKIDLISQPLVSGLKAEDDALLTQMEQDLNEAIQQSIPRLTAQEEAFIEEIERNLAEDNFLTELNDAATYDLAQEDFIEMLHLLSQPTAINAMNNSIGDSSESN